MASILILLPFFTLIGHSEAAVTATVNTVSTWNGGGQAQIVLKNSGPNPVCAVTFQMTTPSGTTVTSSWNMDSAGSNKYTTPSWMNIPSGGQSTDAGVVYNGSSAPTVSVVSSTDCGGSTTTTTTAKPTTTKAGATTKATTATTKAGATTTTTKAATTTTAASSGGGATMTVTTDPSNAALNKCLKGSTSDPINAVLNKPYSSGIFTFYWAGGTGACGQDAGKPVMSAAVSGQLFNSAAQWVAPCTGTQYMMNDNICINKCVKITYTCVGCTTAKTLIVPANNKCPECAPDHVDLSEAAFNYLEPQGGTVGIAKNAVITYITCP